MSILPIGLTGGDAASDRLNVSSGAPAYQAVVPSDSFAANSIKLDDNDAIERPWYKNGATKQVDVTFAYTGRLRMAALDVDNPNVRFGIGRAGAEIVSLSVDLGGNWTLRLAGSVVDTGLAGPAAATWERPIVDIDGLTENDEIRVYNGSTTTALITHTVTAGEAAALAPLGVPNEWQIGNAGTGEFDVTDLGILDRGDGISWVTIDKLETFTVKGVTVTGDGTPQTWTGTFEDINDLPFDSADLVYTDTVDTVATFTRPTLAGLTDEIGAIVWQSGAKLIGTEAGTNMDLRADDGSTTDVSVAVPVDGRVTAVYDAAPSGSLTPSSVDATALRYISRT